MFISQRINYYRITDELFTIQLSSRCFYVRRCRTIWETRMFGACSTHILFATFSVTNSIMRNVVFQTRKLDCCLPVARTTTYYIMKRLITKVCRRLSYMWDFILSEISIFFAIAISNYGKFFCIHKNVLFKQLTQTCMQEIKCLIF